MKSKLFISIMGVIASYITAQTLPYTIVDTGVETFYNNDQIISQPSVGDAFYGQDANYSGIQPSYTNNGDGTITDNNTGLMWQQADDGNFYDWENALSTGENLTLAGHTDWRLPNPKELHSIVDYTRCPDVTNSPAIDSIFSTTEILDPYGNPNQYPYFWTGTTHINSPNPYFTAAYFAFGEAQGIINNQLMDVHGAGAQRSDWKTGDPADYPIPMGPQGDIHYVFNAVRYVRDIDETVGIGNDYEILNQFQLFPAYPNPFNPTTTIRFLVENKQLKASLDIYDVNGRLVETILDGPIVSGNHEIQWNASNYSSGIYFAKLIVGNNVNTQKLVLVK